MLTRYLLGFFFLNGIEKALEITVVEIISKSLISENCDQTFHTVKKIYKVFKTSKKVLLSSIKMRHKFKRDIFR